MYPEQPQPKPNYPNPNPQPKPNYPNPHPQPNYPQPQPNYPQPTPQPQSQHPLPQIPKQPLPIFKILAVIFAVSLVSLIGYVALPNITGAFTLTGDSNSSISKDQMILDLTWDMNLLFDENDRIKSEKSDCINKKAQTQDNLTICTSDKQTYADDKDSLLLQLSKFTNGSSDCDTNFTKCRDDLFNLTIIITDNENDYNALENDYNLLRGQHDSNVLELNQCNINLELNSLTLDDCRTEMSFCQDDLDICMASNCETEIEDLNICQADLFASQEDFNISQADLNVCNTNLDSNITALDTCQTDFGSCQVDLNSSLQLVLDLNTSYNDVLGVICDVNEQFCCDTNAFFCNPY